MNGTYIFQWQVRKIVLELPNNRRQRNHFFSLRSNSSEESKKEEGKDLSDFLLAVRILIASIYQHQARLADPADTIRKLNKLIIYVLEADSWPFKNSISDIIGKFKEYETLCCSSSCLIDNQNKFKTFVSRLSKVLCQRAMSFEVVNISDKMISKLRRGVPQGVQLFERAQELIRIGTERIYWPEKTQHEEIIHFAKLFALHAYVYKKDADNQQAREKLAQQLDRFLELIIAYDYRNQSSTLGQFSHDLLEWIKLYHQGCFDAIHESSYGALVWIGEILVNNSKFINYMRLLEKQEILLKATLQSLFLHERTWKMIGELIISLENFTLFKEVLRARLAVTNRQCLLNEEQIGTLFFLLNTRLQEKQNRAVYEQMTYHFLDLLSQTNRLHYLKPYAEDIRYIAVLRLNLLQLGFSFMSAPQLALSAFFGNATFRAVKGNWDVVPVGDNVRIALLRLFSKCGKNPVESERDFNQTLQSLLADFRNENFEMLCEEILGSIGEGIVPLFEEVNGCRTWISVETWLSKEVVGLYQTLKKYILLCLPIRWRKARLDDAENYLGQVCLLDHQFYTIQYGEGNQLILQDFLTKETQIPSGQDLLLGGLLSKVETCLKDQMNPSGSQQVETRELNRRGISRLAEKYLLFHHDKQDKRLIQQLLDLIIKKIIDDQLTVSFSGRLEILAEFLNAMSPVLASLEKLVKLRFYTNEHTLKLNVARELARKAGEEGEALTQLLPAEGIHDPVDFSPMSVSVIAGLLSTLCAGDIKKILTRCSLEELKRVATQLESVICRKVDELSYVPQEFIESFLANEVNRDQLNATILREVIGDLSIKEQIIQDYGDFLKERPIPVYFLLPNQALAIQLCLSDRRELETKNLLMRIGTGQGKSIVIALAALNEAKKIRNQANSHVFVFTSYDHLARRDHELGKDFFRRENISSLCISEMKDVAYFNEGVKIIYGDVENIENIIREIMLKWLRRESGNEISDAEKAFMGAIYGIRGGDIRIILDEYDLLLHDLTNQDSKVAKIPTTFLEESFVRNHQEYCDFLPNQINRGSTTTEVQDPNSGKRSLRVSWHAPGVFNLPVAVMRLTALIGRAKRVIGFSGTASYQESHQLPNRLFFEIPSSQNPEIFETKILRKGDPKPAGDKSYISCLRYLEIKEGVREVDKMLEVSHVKVKEYCDAVVNDIKIVRKANEEEGYQRPIIIFASDLVCYREAGEGKGKRLWDKLVDAIRAADIPLSFLSKNVSDTELQEVAREGRVTLTTIENGRGADIRVNSKIEEGLHVLIATSVSQPRLLNQLIGRTGRMGRKGSYSIVTLGDLVKSPTEDFRSVSQFYQALHELTKLFIKQLVDNPQYRADHCKKWILFLAKAFSTRLNSPPVINRRHAYMFCGKCDDNEVLRNFLK